MSSPLPDRSLEVLFREQRQEDAGKAPSFEALANAPAARGGAGWKPLAWAAAMVLVAGLLALVAGRPMGGPRLIAVTDDWPDVEWVLPEEEEEELTEWESPTAELLMVSAGEGLY
jgi:hypothetical protein